MTHLPHEILQKRMNAFVSEKCHTYYIAKIRNRILLIDSLSICVPILILGFQHAPIADPTVKTALAAATTIISSLLLALVVFSGLRGYTETLYQHQKLLTENMGVISQINYFLEKSDRNQDIDMDAVNRLMGEIHKIDSVESDFVSDVPKRLFQRFYRKALFPASQDPDVVCPTCHSSPLMYVPIWRAPFKKRCESCGNVMTRKPVINKPEA